MRDWTNWPTMSTYLAWATANGCAVEHDQPSSTAPGAHRLVTIVAPSGQRAVEVFVEDNEFLMSTTVSRLDRRLGLKSWLFN